MVLNLKALSCMWSSKKFQILLSQHPPRILLLSGTALPTHGGNRCSLHQPEHLSDTEPAPTPLLYPPNCDEVVVGLRLQQGEVEVDSVSHWHCEKPSAVLGIGVLVGEARRVNCTVLGGEVPPARHCR